MNLSFLSLSFLNYSGKSKKHFLSDSFLSLSIDPPPPPPVRTREEEKGKDVASLGAITGQG
jgi:hypothetical protein